MDNFWKNRKVIFFIALKHHTRFLVPLGKYLNNRGAKVLYVIAQGENPQELTAKEFGLAYKHVFDYITSEDKNAIFENYTRQRDYFSEAIREDPTLAIREVTIIDRTLLATAKEYVGFRNLIRREKPDLCFALHELNRWGKILGFWAKKFNVGYITLQEGLNYDFAFTYTGHVQYSTFNLVWGKRVQKKLSEFEAPADRIIPVGNTHLSDEIERLERENAREKKRKQYHCINKYVVLLFLPPHPPEPEKYLTIFEHFKKNPGKKIVLKWHPTARKPRIAEWLKRIPREIRKHILSFHGEESPYELMAMSDLCVLTEPSTTGLEAIAMGKPLVKLKFSSVPKMPYSFVEKGVAIPFTPQDFAKALEDNFDFEAALDRKTVENYLKEELVDTKGCVERIISIAQDMIKAREAALPQPLKIKQATSSDWSIIFPVLNDPAVFLTQLEGIVKNSEGQGTYEVLLLEKENLSKEVLNILDNLSGDVKRIPWKENESLYVAMNRAAEEAQGKMLLFANFAFAPAENWLKGISRGVERYGRENIYGGRIANHFGSIVHAGVILNANNSPVSAYKHLDLNFPLALKERSFKLLDKFIALERDFFCQLGGLREKCGKYSFMDLCLRAQKLTGKSEASIYLPDVLLVMLAELETEPGLQEAISFYCKWHGVLWENEDALYTADNITRIEVQKALLERLNSLKAAAA